MNTSAGRLAGGSRQPSQAVGRPGGWHDYMGGFLTKYTAGFRLSRSIHQKVRIGAWRFRPALGPAWGASSAWMGLNRLPLCPCAESDRARRNGLAGFAHFDCNCHLARERRLSRPGLYCRVMTVARRPGDAGTEAGKCVFTSAFARFGQFVRPSVVAGRLRDDEVRLLRLVPLLPHSRPHPGGV